jgi:hypothetical protein
LAELSGPQWCARFPGSKSPDDLAPEWRGRVWAFLSALKNAGATVDISATYRPPERAYLMHWCWMIANLSQSPAAVPHMAGIDIDWTHHGDISAARAAARAMVKAYDLEVLPVLDSHHTHRRAIDMTIGWHGMLTIRDFDANLHHIGSSPHDGTNHELAQVGASFGVFKLASDAPHWSDDGH